MRKLLWIIAIVVVLVTTGYGQITTEPKQAVEVKQSPAPKPMGALVLPKTDAQKKEFVTWQQVYGFNDLSHVYYNLVMLLNIIDQHGKLINTNRQYIGMIFAVDDPNSLVSTVVADHNSIDALKDENAELKKTIADLTKRVEVLEKLPVIEIKEGIITLEHDDANRVIKIEVEKPEEPEADFVDPNGRVIGFDLGGISTCTGL